MRSRARQLDGVGGRLESRRARTVAARQPERGAGGHVRALAFRAASPNAAAATTQSAVDDLAVPKLLAPACSLSAASETNASRSPFSVRLRSVRILRSCAWRRGQR